MQRCEQILAIYFLSYLILTVNETQTLAQYYYLFRKFKFILFIESARKKGEMILNIFAYATLGS